MSTIVPVNAGRQSEAEYAVRNEFRKMRRHVKIIETSMEGGTREFKDVAIEVTKSSDGRPYSTRNLLRTYLVTVEVGDKY